MKLKLVLFILAIIAVGLSLSSVATAHPASGIVLDRAGNIYFSDLETIWKVDTNGKLSVFRAGVSGRHVHELAIDEQDNIYGADLSYESQKYISDIWKMTPAGKFEYLLQPTANPPRAMSIWRDRAGNNYWIDQNNHTKTQTLLLRRSPEGTVTTLAGGAWGYADGKGTAAKFSTVGNMAFGPDGNIYLSDGVSVRRVTMEGTVTTLAENLGFRTAEDKPTLFERAYGDLAGINVDPNGNVYVADASNRRLLKIGQSGKVEVVLRTDPPFFPNGVVAAPDGNVFVLEVGFNPPNTTSGPRVRKLGIDGTSTIVAMAGEGSEADSKTAVAAVASGVQPGGRASFAVGSRTKYGIVLLSAGILCIGAIWWQRRRRQRI